MKRTSLKLNVNNNKKLKRNYVNKRRMRKRLRKLRKTGNVRKKRIESRLKPN